MSALNDLGEYAPFAAADEITKCLHTTLHNASCSLFSMYYRDNFKSYDDVRIMIKHMTNALVYILSCYIPKA